MIDDLIDELRGLQSGCATGYRLLDEAATAEYEANEAADVARRNLADRKIEILNDTENQKDLGSNQKARDALVAELCVRERAALEDAERESRKAAHLASSARLVVESNQVQLRALEALASLAAAR